MAEPEAEAMVKYKPSGSDPEVKVVQKGSLTDSGSHRKSSTPILFERSATSWWDPKFDSDILETQHRESSFPQTQRRFQFALGYIIMACLIWAVFFAIMQERYWIPFLAGSVVVLLIAVATLAFTFTNKYKLYYLHTSILIGVILCAACLANFAFDGDEISAVGTFAGTIEILLMMYTVIPLPLYLCVVMGCCHSVAFELLSAAYTTMNKPQYIIGRVFMHICIHMIGIHIFIMSQARRRGTFLKVGQSIMSRKNLEVEKSLKQRMINSLMPARVAQEVMKAKEEKGDEEEERRDRGGKKDSLTKGKLNFRTFHMSQMDNVSILFADIVGFTKMSSNKTAEHLVSLLNDLFGRFDSLCAKSGCEKISTLGDCYYCVSGCPEARPDHAKCCIEMGREMVNKIKEFDEDHNETVDMRVGVHTGTVLCGIVGTRRFKFDVWSNDVTLANTMESEGKPGMVHISEPTYLFVKDIYEVEQGETVPDIRKHKVLIEDYNPDTQQFQIRHIRDEDTIQTYFVLGPKRDGASRQVSNGGGDGKATDGVATDATDVKINMEDGKDDKELDNDGGFECTMTEPIETTPLQPQHNDLVIKGDANGMSPAAMLAKREKIGSSENVQNGDATNDEENEQDGALLDQLQQQRHDQEQTDKELIQYMQDESHTQEYLYRPPINPCTLNFNDAIYEAKYRDQYLDDDTDEVRPTFAAPRFSAFFDLLVSMVFFTLLAISCFLGFTIRLPWILFFVFAFFLECALFLPVMLNLCVGGELAKKIRAGAHYISSWYPRHVIGAVIASLPALAVYANFSCDTFSVADGGDMFYCLLLVVSLLHFCNFTTLSSWMKSSLATIVGIVLLILLGIGVCSMDTSIVTTPFPSNTTTAPATLTSYGASGRGSNFTVVENSTSERTFKKIFSNEHPLRFEIILDMTLLLLLLWFLNREFEVNYRLSFHGDVQAMRDRKKMKAEKEQADWLLHNIIPEHVSDVLKKTTRYCENHKDVGVVFAKVSNFDDFYDESFEGGKEYLRVLNELLGDFEELFDDPKYKDVEKIKSIGSCLMAASGLNPKTRDQNKDPNAHLYALMSFCIDLNKKLDQFNAEIFNFDFEMSIGYNYGEVTAGVIGTTKLLYDIWGNTVNISSRMYSTGMNGRIQVTEDTAKKLEDKFDFEYRGKVFVKGKGDMSCYMLTGPKPGATWE